MPKHMKLGAFLMPTGHHVAAWRHPDAAADMGLNVDQYIRVAQTAEKAGFDLVFLEDAAGLRDENARTASQTSRSVGFEPLSLLAAIAAQTSRIGLVATASTSYNEPYALARAFATLDLLSGGRAGWNLVTSASEIEAANFGAEGLRKHVDRYHRAGEFAKIVAQLWDPADRSAPLNHTGEHFIVEQGLGLSPSRQGKPVMVQAGASDVGRDLAARTADVVFTAAQTLDSAKSFYDDVKARTRAAGRNPDHLKIMPGVSPVVAATREEAQAKLDTLQSLIPDEVGLSLLASYLATDALKDLPLDGPMPELQATQGMQSRQQLVVEQARRDNLSIREVARHFAGARGHWRLVGTAEDIADELEAWFTGGACDGFNVMPAFFPGELDSFVALVVPELQRRGLFRRAYEGETLRDNLGLNA
ncbi:LLM class flavin-dependent oxidoreductase [Tianweitania sp. BSSL-BM11]|uniref:LLM class flavin-dependent oxidoreductase n=1 Tax=Tianweitania aestuarii TaxID=2814886 RepID=A0ABS5S108_9HYPH|nr:LLM class flavin-dependent oxidoreductase [Tianweitania aestuarii]MBS9722222.1 LLM class flavin-dependent oxidoreductase [Tianweitania aestuarii]